MKVNKSFLKRLKLTRTGKVLSRKAGQNHFNAKQAGRKQIGKSRMSGFVVNNKLKSRYLIK